MDDNNRKKLSSDQVSRINPIFTLSDNGGIKNESHENGLAPMPRTLSRTLSITSYSSGKGLPLNCGYGRFTPKLLQYFHNAKCLLMCMCFCCITQGMLINGFIPVSITSVEKRFQLSSTQSGVYASMYDIAVLIALIPVCHYGGQGHKGRWLGVGMFIMGIGSLICALPQFVTGPYEYGQSHNETCILEETVQNRTELTSLEINQQCLKNLKPDNVQNYFYVLLLGQLLNGFGAAPLYTLGITYIDENVSQKSSPMYLGIYMAFSVVGPALGFILGGMFLKLFGDVGKVDLKKVTITQNDPSWYGAWWLGMVLTAILSIMFSVPLLGFARELPEAKRHRKKDVIQTNAQSLKSEPAFGTNIGNLPKNCWELLKNRTYSCLIVMKCAEAFIMNGMVTFIPKLVENLFSVSSSSASLITGAVVVPGGFLGNILGGYIIKRFKLRCGAVILMACICQVLSLFLILSMLIYCPEARFVGVNVPPSHDSRTVALSQDCNQACSCTNLYMPVCHELTNQVYYSPCHAGCLDHAARANDKMVWTNCSCMTNVTSFPHDSSQTVVQGLCDTGCKLLPVFLVVFGFQVLVTFTAAMPIQQAELRCVPFKQRTLAVSLSWVFVRIFGSIPGAILFGIAIDSSCALWQMECGETKSCLRYASRKMALAIMSFGLSFKGAIIIFLLLAWKFYRPPPESEEAPEDHNLSNKIAPTKDKIKIIKL